MNFVFISVVSQNLELSLKLFEIFLHSTKDTLSFSQLFLVFSGFSRFFKGYTSFSQSLLSYISVFLSLSSAICQFFSPLSQLCRYFLLAQSQYCLSNVSVLSQYCLSYISNFSHSYLRFISLFSQHSLSIFSAFRYFLVAFALERFYLCPHQSRWLIVHVGLRVTLRPREMTDRCHSFVTVPVDKCYANICCLLPF